MFDLWGRSLYNRYVFFLYVLYILLILQVADTTSQWFAPMTSWVTLVQRDSTQALPWTSQCLSICSCPPCHSHSMDSQCQWVCQIISQSKSVKIHFWHTFYQTRYMKEWLVVWLYIGYVFTGNRNAPAQRGTGRRRGQKPPRYSNTQSQQNSSQYSQGNSQSQASQVR